jgi:ABC-type branched-subunit amino acid transport system substrate-binding protein
MKRAFLMTSLLLAGVFLLAPLNAVAADPVKIGVIVPLSGIVAQGGEEMKMGIQMAAEEKKTIL